MDKVDRAFEKVDRSLFIPSELKHKSHIDAPLLIGYGQTISQPTTVRWMLEWLEVSSGDKVLDVGSGSGWTTALLSYLVGPKGKVYAVERIPELLAFGEENCKRAEVKNARFYPAGEVFGLDEEAPFDRILVSASAVELPEELLGQLKTGGKMVIPVVNDVLEISKTSKGDYDTKTHPGFSFVPLI